jgi:hypothetical protein
MGARRARCRESIAAVLLRTVFHARLAVAPCLVAGNIALDCHARRGGYCKARQTTRGLAVGEAAGEIVCTHTMHELGYT